MDDLEDEAHEAELEECWHTMIVSISDAECQCTGCLRIWDKEPGFKSDWPMQDRG